MKNLFKKIVVSILTWEARLLLNHHNPKIITVTGSVGKTSTKDAIHTIVASKSHTRKSEKSFNSEIGVPLTILGLKNAWSNPFRWAWNIKLGFWRIFFSKNYPKILVLEVGADQKNDIKNIVSWVKPDISVITALAEVPVHVANFASPEEVWAEKGRLVEALGQDGVAILNGDDKRVLEMRNKTKSRIITYGIQDGEESFTIPDIIATKPEIAYSKEGKITGTNFKIDYKNEIHKFKIDGAFGEGHVYSLLAAASVGIALGMQMEEIQKASESIVTPPGRMRILKGIKGSTVIDDSYNSSPVAARLALKTLGEIKTTGPEGMSRRIACLGDMRELGEFAIEEHKKIGKLVKDVADILITVGPLSRFVALGSLENGMDENNIFQFENSRKAGKFLQGIIKEGDIVLAKGSQNTIRMEWLVEEIMAEPERKKELLVRQDKEWQNH